jgi:hypothetical protein
VIFGRKSDYVMEVDLEVHYPIDQLRSGTPELAAMPEDESKTWPSVIRLEEPARKIYPVAQVARGRH